MLKPISIRKRYDSKLTDRLSPVAQDLAAFLQRQPRGPKKLDGCYSVNQFPAFGESEILCNGLR